MPITLRPDENQQKTIETLKQSLGVKTSSKALLLAAERFPEALDRIDSMRSKQSELEFEIRRLREIIEDARYAAAQLVEVTGQSDLLGA